MANTLMIEPTESESKEELDRFIDALVSIRQEIREVEEGKVPREGNVLKNAPHPMADLVDGDGKGKWERVYSREKAAFPVGWLREKKFWPSVGRVDDSESFFLLSSLVAWDGGGASPALSDRPPLTPNTTPTFVDLH